MGQEKISLTLLCSQIILDHLIQKLASMTVRVLKNPSRGRIFVNICIVCC